MDVYAPNLGLIPGWMSGPWDGGLVALIVGWFPKLWYQPQNLIHLPGDRSKPCGWSEALALN